MRRIAVRVGLVVVLAGLGAGGTAVWARAEKHAPEHGGVLSIKTIADQNFCLESEGDGRVIVSTCANRDNQKWTLTDDTDGSNVVTDGYGECLDRGDGLRGTPLGLKGCDFGPSQRFRYVPRNGRLIDPNGTSCVAATEATQDAQVVDEGCHAIGFDEAFAIGE